MNLQYVSNTTLPETPFSIWRKLVPTEGREAGDEVISVQDPLFPQNYNRYSYCWNNPLKFTDPDGNFVGLIFTTTFTTAEFIVNGIEGRGWSLKNAYSATSETASLLSNMARFTIYESQSGNTMITAGIDPFALGVSVNASHVEGDFSFDLSAGYGIMNGYFVGMGVGYSHGDGYRHYLGGSLGSNYRSIGGSSTKDGYGLGYTYTHYGAGTAPGGQAIGSQNTGTLTAHWPGGSFRIENDFLAFQHQDRWRTSAWELSIGDFSIGSYVYTNDPKNEAIAQGGDPYTEKFVDYTGTSLSGKLNKPMKDGQQLGAWRFGDVYSSPMWLGHRNANTVSRIGYSHPLIQDKTQNWVHRCLVRQNYYNNYTMSTYGAYMHSGYNNSFSLYGR